jgi:hypothetical protein
VTYYTVKVQGLPLEKADRKEIDKNEQVHAMLLHIKIEARSALPLHLSIPYICTQMAAWFEERFGTVVDVAFACDDYDHVQM